MGRQLPEHVSMKRPLNLLFATDATFRRGSDGEVLTDCALWAPVWRRYLSAFDQMMVVGREQPPNRAPSLATVADAPGVDFALLPNVNGLAQTRNRPRVHRELSALVQQADAVVAVLPTEMGLQASSLARKMGKPLLVEVVGSGYEAFSMHGSLLATCYAPVMHLRMARAVRTADVALYVTQSWLQSQYPSPNRPLEWLDNEVTPAATPEPGYIQAGVPDVIVSMPDEGVIGRRGIRNAELAQGRPPVFGTVASLTPRFKGIQFALAALSRLAAEGAQFQYRVLGPGDPRPWQAIIAQLGLTNFCFLDGAVDPGQPVLDWLDGIDVHVQPSLTESLSRSTIEALSRGVACTASSAGGLPEYLPPDWLHRPGDAAELGAHLRQLIESPSRVVDLSEDSLRRVRRFDPRLIDGRRQFLYRHLARLCEGPMKEARL